MLKRIVGFFVLVGLITGNISAQSPSLNHPNTSGSDWKDLFDKDLSNALYGHGLWSDSAGVITAVMDSSLWSKKMYNNFILDLEFKNSKGTNSGVFVHASDIRGIRDLVEIQIADDFDPEWANSPASWQCGAILVTSP